MNDYSPQNLRRHILEMAYRAQAIHIPCALSIVDIVSTLAKIKTEEDWVILSKGHGVLAIYAWALETGELTLEESLTYLQDGSRLFGLSDHRAPGCVINSGSLGHGLPIATGMALGLKRTGKPGRVFCIVGDGELQAGPNWEAIQFASHHQLSNLYLILDDNGFQALGKTQEILDQYYLMEKRFLPFGWMPMTAYPATVFESFTKLCNRSLQRPRVLIVNTVKGDGVSFMRNNNAWHYRKLHELDYLQAISEL